MQSPQSTAHEESEKTDIGLADLASPEVLARARKIKLFLMDVDGTLTDGGVCLISTTAADGRGNSAISEMKVFNAKDGQGLSLAHTMGIQTGFITGRHSPAVAKRAEELKVTFVYPGQARKTEAFEECMQKAGVTEEEIAYLGDDLPDIPLARETSLSSARGVHWYFINCCRNEPSPRIAFNPFLEASCRRWKNDSSESDRNYSI
jgi:3-deoxy-D-manno-octulosonate 8-phosphate phosphatase (KDO 8-P phosphatase)